MRSSATLFVLLFILDGYILANGHVGAQTKIEMVQIPAGPFTMGSDGGAPDERPRTRWIYRPFRSISFRLRTPSSQRF